MTPGRNTDTREALLQAASAAVAAAPGQDVSLRAVCDRVGVQLSTLYHYFGSKDGLLDAVVERGFDDYLARKEADEPTGDPVEDLRRGWDVHVRYGVENPGHYALMYGRVAPGYRPAAQERATVLLRGLTAEADRQGRLVVPPGQAADHVLATNVGVTLHLIAAAAEADWELAGAVRDVTLAGITGERLASGGGSAPGDGTPEGGVAAASATLLRALAHEREVLDPPEEALLRKWLALLSRAGTDTPAAY